MHALKNIAGFSSVHMHIFFSYGKIKYHSACGFLGLIYVHVITLHVSIYTSFLKDIWLHACITNNYYHHDYADILAMALHIYNYLLQKDI